MTPGGVVQHARRFFGFVVVRVPCQGPVRRAARGSTETLQRALVASMPVHARALRRKSTCRRTEVREGIVDITWPQPLANRDGWRKIGDS